MSNSSYERGKAFEAEVEALLQPLAVRFPSRVKVLAQVEIPLNDGGAKTVDFTVDYRLASSNHQVALECQDRAKWSTGVLDKILVIRNHSPRNRFWLIYREPHFLTKRGRKRLDKHGILHFSLPQFREHVAAMKLDLLAAEVLESLRAKLDVRGLLSPPARLQAYAKQAAELLAALELDLLKAEIFKLTYKPPSDQSMSASPPPFSRW